MMCQRIGFPPTSTIGFGRSTVSSLSLVPIPPARITALGILGKLLMAHFKPILHAFQALTFGGVFDVDRNRGQHESPTLSAVRESAVSHADAQMPRLSAVHRPFDGVTLLARTPSEDHRGVFDRLYCSEELSGFIGGRNIAQASTPKLVIAYCGTPRAASCSTSAGVPGTGPGRLASQLLA